MPAYEPNYQAPGATAAASTSGDNGSAPSDREPGLLELPFDEYRRSALAVRASWAVISQNLENRTKLTSSIRSSVEKIEGVQDDVITDLVLRHVRDTAAVRARRLPLCCVARLIYACMLTRTPAPPLVCFLPVC